MDMGLYENDPDYKDFIEMLRLRFPEKIENVTIERLWQVFKDGVALGWVTRGERDRKFDAMRSR